MIKGRVQGVGFRASASSRARSLEIYGTVENLNDGSVEIYCCGDKKNLDPFIDYLKNNPGWSSVSDININKINDKNKAEKILNSGSFNILR